MGNLIDLNSQIPDSRIPDAIARDAETTAAINAHLGVVDPHPQYLTQSEGDALYPKFLRRILTSTIPSTANGMLVVPHGLAAGKIITFSSFVLVYPGSISEVRIPPGGLAPWMTGGFYYSIDCGPTNITARTSTNSGALFGAAITFVIDHLP